MTRASSWYEPPSWDLIVPPEHTASMDSMVDGFYRIRCRCGWERSCEFPAVVMGAYKRHLAPRDPLTNTPLVEDTK